MSDKLGFVRYAPADTREFQLPEKSYSDETAKLIDLEIRRLVDEAYAEARQMLEGTWEKVVAVAEALLRYETLTADEVQRLLRGEVLNKPTVSDLISAEAKRNADEQKRANVKPAEPQIPPGAMPRPA
jgi:cell division protease FtsH